MRVACCGFMRPVCSAPRQRPGDEGPAGSGRRCVSSERWKECAWTRSRCDELTKSYDGLTVVDHLSLRMPPGEVFALLGPNGAGKTTTVEILEGHRRPDSGTVSVLGYDPQRRERALRERIGVVLQEAGFDDEFTVRELVRYFHALFAHPLDVDDVLEEVGLSRQAVGEGANTVRRSAATAGPRTGADRRSRGAVPRRADRGIRPCGSTSGVVADRALEGTGHDRAPHDPLPRRGRAARRSRGNPRGRTAGGARHAVGTGGGARGRDGLVPPSGRKDHRGPASISASNSDADGAGWRLATRHPSTVVHELTGWAIDAGFELPALEVRRPTLEDAYLGLVGERAVLAGAGASVVSARHGRGAPGARDPLRIRRSPTSQRRRRTRYAGCWVR